MTIRLAAAADAARLAELSGVLGYPVAADVMAQRLSRVLGRGDGIVLVAELPAGRIAGWAHGVEQHLLESAPRCELVGLVVDAGHRRQGIGHRLVAAVEAWAAARGLGQVAVRSNVVRAEAHPFYEHLGYRRVKTQYAYVKEVRSQGRPAAVPPDS